VTSVVTDTNLNPGMPQVVGAARTNVDREGPGDEMQDPDGGRLSADWEDNWFGQVCVSGREGGNS
jgi:hypothetical protein